MTQSVQASPAAYAAREPSREATQQWAKAHATEIDQYNAWASEREPYAQRVKRWREQGGA